MWRKPPLVTVASMVAARFRGKNTTMSPLPEASCDAPPRRTAPPPEGGSGLIHAVIVPPDVAACRAPATRVRQILALLDLTFIGPGTYISRMPPPPTWPRTEAR